MFLYVYIIVTFQNLFYISVVYFYFQFRLRLLCRRHK